MSQPKILADENIESSLIKFLERKGFDVKYASKGLRNSELLNKRKIYAMLDLTLLFHSYLLL